MKTKTKMKSSAKVFKSIAFVVIALYAAIIVYALFWAFISSIKNGADFAENPIGFPNIGKHGLHFENYSRAYQLLSVEKKLPNGQIGDVYFLELLANSLIYAGLASFLNLFSSMLVAYCVIKFSNKVTNVFYVAALVCLTMPSVGTLPASLQIMRSLKLYDNMFGMIALKVSYATTYFLVFCGVFQGVPNDYAEAAKIDGAGNWGIFFKIMVPMVSSTLFACFLLLFITYWNDYSTPMIYMPNTPVLSYGLYKFQNHRAAGMSDPIKLAASLIVCLPSIVLFVVFRNKIMENVAMGGLKG